jgi:hypothetical protein
MTQHHNTLLIDGKGQANEGSGHDPWEGYDYDRLNKVHIASVQATGTTLEVIGEASGAYRQQLGLEEFRRRLVFDGQKASVQDDIRSSKPHQYTVLLHADSGITQQGKDFLLKDRAASFRVNIVAPTDPVTRIEPNNVTAPGPPGAVDKGQVQARGLKLEISNRTATRDLQVKTELTLY